MDKIEFSTGGFPLSTDRLADMQQCWQFIAELAKAWGNNAVIHGCSGWTTGGAVSDGLIVFNGELLPFRSGGQGNRVQVIEQKYPITYSDGSQRTFRTTRYATATTSSASGTLPQSSFAQASQIPQLVTNAAMAAKASELANKTNSARTELLGYISDINLAISSLTNGNVNLNAKITDHTQWLVPAGAIIMWSGAINQIPTGWRLCDGEKGTPDLRGRFVVGAGNKLSAPLYSVGDTGGYDFITLTEEQIPPHSHKYNLDRQGSGTWKTGGSDSSPNSTTIFDKKDERFTHKGGGNDYGSTDPFDNRPPYYALAYIMKLRE